MEVKGDVVCDHQRKRKMRVAWRSGLPGTWVPGVHANCIHNEIAALCLRSLAPLPVPSTAPVGPGFRGVALRLARWVRRYDGNKWSHLETALSYSGSLRRRYLEAERSLRVDGPLGERDVKLRAFLKAEKLKPAAVAKPRMIFPRSPRYNLMLASWLKPFEHWLWGRLSLAALFGAGHSRTRVVAKGLSPRQRANLIVRKFGDFSRCVVFEVDAKAFEAHVTRAQLQREHSVYLSAYRRVRGLYSLLRHQLSLVGTTSFGVKFRRKGGRASGDFNTGMGNTIIMLCAVAAVLAGRGFSFDLLVDGDNALVFCEEGDLPAILRDFSQRILADSGHEVTLEKPVTSLEAVRFGQSAPVFLGHGLGWTMVREWTKVLSGFGASHRWLTEPRYGRRWLNGVARCELSLALGVPILQAAALGVLRATGVVKQAAEESLRDYFVVGAWLAGEEDVVEVTRECRDSFARAFGVDPEAQLRMEKMPFVVGHAASVVEIPSLERLWSTDPGLLESYLDAQVD